MAMTFRSMTESTLSVLRQIYSAFSDYIFPFLWAVAKLAWSGFRFASREEAYTRWDICSQCKHYDEERVSCGVCGCGVTPDVGGFRRLFEKVYYRDEKCPAGKWGRLQ